nr:hypothetical protein [Myxococcota bacterium]
QLGRTLASGTTSPEEGPVDGLAATATRIVAAAARTCAIDAAGALSCWGLDDPLPLALDAHEPMHELRASPTGGVFCGLAGETRAPVCFGRPETDSAFWPEGGSEPRAAPSPMHRSPLPTDVRAIANDAATACIVSESGELWCWGANDRGQLAQGRSGAAETIPVRVTIPAG